MSVEFFSTPIVASVAGVAVVFGMSARLLTSLALATFVRRGKPRGEFLELSVNGKDYSLDLRSIGNGGSAKIKSALRELERCH